MAKTVTPLPIPVAQVMADADTLGRFIRAARTQSGMGIHEAAAFCSVSVSTLSNLERAKGDVRLSSILQVCRMLGVTLMISAGDSQ